MLRRTEANRALAATSVGLSVCLFACVLALKEQIKENQWMLKTEEWSALQAYPATLHPSVLLVWAVRLEDILICSPPELNGR